MKKLILALFIILYITSCTQRKSQNSIIEDKMTTSNTNSIPKENKKNLIFQEFKKAFIENQAENSKFHTFMVEMRIPTDEPYDHIALHIGNLIFDGETFKGIIGATSMESVSTYKVGDTIIINPDLVTDWVASMRG